MLQRMATAMEAQTELLGQQNGMLKRQGRQLEQLQEQRAPPPPPQYHHNQQQRAPGFGGAYGGGAGGGGGGVRGGGAWGRTPPGSVAASLASRCPPTITCVQAGLMEALAEVMEGGMGGMTLGAWHELPRWHASWDQVVTPKAPISRVSLVPFTAGPAGPKTASFGDVTHFMPTVVASPTGYHAPNGLLVIKYQKRR